MTPDSDTNWQNSVSIPEEQNPSSQTHCCFPPTPAEPPVPPERSQQQQQQREEIHPQQGFILTHTSSERLARRPDPSWQGVCARQEKQVCTVPIQREGRPETGRGRSLCSQRRSTAPPPQTHFTTPEHKHAWVLKSFQTFDLFYATDISATKGDVKSNLHHQAPGFRGGNKFPLNLTVKKSTFTPKRHKFTAVNIHCLLLSFDFVLKTVVRGWFF